MEIMNIGGIDCYEENGTAFLKLEAVARGLGFTQRKDGAEYVKWERVNGYLEELGFSPQVGKDGFIPENIFYRLAMKAKNEVAEAFQAKVADEIIPSIRKTGGYLAAKEGMTDAEIMARALVVAQNTIRQREERIERMKAETAALEAKTATMQPKADYFDALVDRNLLTSFSVAAKEIGVKRKKLIGYLTENGYLYRDRKGVLLPCAGTKTVGLFEVKECMSQASGWAGYQTMITPRGMETFRLLCEKL